MSTKHLVAVSILTIILTASAFAQGEFLQEGESGFGLAPEITFGDNAGGYGIAGGFSVMRKIDVGLGYAENTDLKISSYYPSITYHFRERRKKEDVSIAITGGYHSVSDEGSTSQFLSLGLCGYSNRYLSRAAMLQPYMAVQISFNSDNEEADGTDIALGLGLAFAWSMTGPVRPFLSAGAVIPTNSSGDDDAKIVGVIGGGLVFAWKNAR